MAKPHRTWRKPDSPPSYWGTCGTCGTVVVSRQLLVFSPLSAVEGFEVFEESEQIREVGECVFLCAEKNKCDSKKKIYQTNTGIDVHGFLSNDW